MGVRKGVWEAIEGAGPGRVSILIAPTGYGKTSAVHYAWRGVSELWGRVLHVLPLRAIVSDAAAKALSRGVPLDAISYQAMVREVVAPSGHRIRKSPYLFSRYAVTTYDSYVLSLYICPVAELPRLYAHRDVGLLAAAGGGVLLDEAHLVLAIDEAKPAEEGDKVFTTLVHATWTLSILLERPVVMATATLSKGYLKRLIEELRGRPAPASVELHLCLGERGLSYYKSLASTSLHGLDPEYRAHYDEYRRVARTEVSKAPMADDVLRARDYARTVLVFCNTVRRAIDVYMRLRGEVEGVTLLHGRFTEADRDVKLRMIGERLERGEELVVVSTQVLEAGVDLDFDCIVTEAAPPSSLIQRAGRALRRLEELRDIGGPSVIVNVSDESIKSAEAVYPREVVKGAVRRLVDYLGVGRPGFFDWRFTVEKPCFTDLLAAAEYAPDYDYGVDACLNRLLELRVLAEGSIPQLIREVDEYMRGALVRDAALVPLLVERRGVVPVSLDYVRRKCSSVLEMRGEAIVAQLAVGDSLVEREVKLRQLLKQPLTTLHKLEIGEAEFLGIKVREGVYDCEVGLP